MASQSSLEWLELGSFMLLDESGHNWTALLSSLPRLKRLKFKFPYRDFQSRVRMMEITPTRTLTALTHLHWDSRYFLSLSTLLPHCPHLQYIIVSSDALHDDTFCSTGILLDVAKESCPRLKCLEVPIIPHNDYNYGWNGRYTASARGLERLLIHWDYQTADHQLTPTIMDHQQTLNYLDLSIIDDDAYHSLENSISNAASFPMLETLLVGHPESAPSRPIPFVCPLISNSHQLRDLSLSNFKCDPIDLMHALRNCPQLSTLFLWRVQCLSRDDDENPPALHATPQVSLPCLKSLEAIGSSILNDTLLKCFDQLSVLTDVKILKCENVTNRGKREFLCKIRDHRKFEFLHDIIDRVRIK